MYRFMNHRQNGAHVSYLVSDTKLPPRSFRSDTKLPPSSFWSDTKLPQSEWRRGDHVQAYHKALYGIPYNTNFSRSGDNLRPNDTALKMTLNF